MGEVPDDEAPTGLTPTVLGPEVEPSEAWALDDEPDEPPSGWTPRRITTLAVAGSLLVVAADAGVTMWQLRSNPDVATPANAPASAAPKPEPDQREPTTTPRRPPSGPSWGEASTAGTLTPPPVVDHDAVFVANLKKAGWNVWNPADVLGHAHTVCEALRNGDTVASINQQMVTVGLAVST